MGSLDGEKVGQPSWLIVGRRVGATFGSFDGEMVGRTVVSKVGSLNGAGKELGAPLGVLFAGLLVDLTRKDLF